MTRERIVFAILILLVALAALLARPGLVGAGDSITVCRDPDWPQLRFLAYPASEISQYDFSPKPEVGGGIYGDFLVADGTWRGPTGIQINNVWHYVDWNTAYCDFSEDEPEGWKPGAPSIPMDWEDITTDCAWVDINNHDGGWSWVKIGDVRVLLHYGEDLIGGHNQSTDPKDYRLEGTACYE